MTLQDFEHGSILVVILFSSLPVQILSLPRNTVLGAKLLRDNPATEINVQHSQLLTAMLIFLFSPALTALFAALYPDWVVNY